MASNLIYRAAERAFGAEALMVDGIEECCRLQRELMRCARDGEKPVATEELAERIAAMKVLIERITALLGIKEDVQRCRNEEISKLAAKVQAHYGGDWK